MELRKADFRASVMLTHADTFAEEQWLYLESV